METLPVFTITYLKLSTDFKFTIKKGDTFKWLQNHPAASSCSLSTTTHGPENT